MSLTEPPFKFGYRVRQRLAGKSTPTPKTRFPICRFCYLSAVKRRKKTARFFATWPISDTMGASSALPPKIMTPTCAEAGDTSFITRSMPVTLIADRQCCTGTISSSRRGRNWRAHTRKTALVFPSSAGKPVNADNLRHRAFKPALRHSGIAS